MINILLERSEIPENLPPAEDVKKVERRLAGDEKKLLKQTKKKQIKNETGRKINCKYFGNNNETVIGPLTKDYFVQPSVLFVFPLTVTAIVCL